MKIYKSYGVLAHEKNPFYSVGAPASDIYDVIDVAIPYEVSFNAANEPLVDFGDMTYLLRDVLTNRGDAPVLSWRDASGKSHWKQLRQA